jgi:hypothetical protein
MSTTSPDASLDPAPILRAKPDSPAVDESPRPAADPYSRPTQVLTAAVRRVLEWHLRHAVRH